MEEKLEQRVNNLEKRVAALEVQIQAQPTELKISKEEFAKYLTDAFHKAFSHSTIDDTLLN